MSEDNVTNNYQSEDYGAQPEYQVPPPIPQDEEAPREEVAPQSYDQPRENEYGEMPAATTSDTSTQPTNYGKDDSAPKGFWGERKKRIIAVSLFLLWLCVFSFPRWANSADVKPLGQEFVNAYKLHVAGAFFIFIGVFFIFGLLAMEKRMNCFENKWVRLAFGALFLLGGFLYWVGGIQLAKSLNDLGKSATSTYKYHLSGWAGAAFIESTLVALMVIALDADVVFDYLSKSVRIRTYLVFNTILTFVALVAFFSYAAWRGYGLPIKGSAGSVGCIAAGWFFVLVACVYWFVVQFSDLCCRCSEAAKEQAKTPRVKIAGIVLLLWGAFLVMVGMWAISTTSSKYWNCYYAGYGFFVFYFCTFMALDFHLGDIVNERFGKK